MIVKLRLLLEWSCWPVWLYDENDEFENTLLPEDLRSNTELQALLDDIQNRFNALYLDTPYEFSWIGFPSQAEEDRFKADWYKAVAKLKEAAGGKYVIVDDVRNAFPAW